MAGRLVVGIDVAVAADPRLEFGFEDAEGSRGAYLFSLTAVLSGERGVPLRYAPGMLERRSVFTGGRTRGPRPRPRPVFNGGGTRGVVEDRRPVFKESGAAEA